MLAFWIAAIGMIALGLSFFLPALFGVGQRPRLDRGRLNLLLHQHRQQELAGEAGEVSELRQLTAESERNLLGDLESPSAPPPNLGKGRPALIVTLILVPVLAIPTYLGLGRPDLINAPASTPEARQMPDIEVAIRKLSERLQQNPEDLDGWVMLGRSLLTIERPDQAVRAFEYAQRLAPDDLEIKAMSAEALAAAAGGRMEGRPAAIIEEILAKDPNHKSGLWLAGFAAAEGGDQAKAVATWRKLQGLLPAGSEAAEQVGRLIAEAEGTPAPAKAAAAPAPAPGKQIRVRVALAEPLKAAAVADDALFIFARAPEGPPMPLAVVRKRVRDLPLEVTLDDSMAMMAGRKLSAFDRVILGARVSKSGQPIPQPGDLQGLTSPIEIKDGAVYDVVVDSKVGETAVR